MRLCVGVRVGGSVKLEYDRESEVGQKVYEQILSIVAVVVLVVVLRANVWKKNVHSCTDCIFMNNKDLFDLI